VLREYSLLPRKQVRNRPHYIVFKRITEKVLFNNCFKYTDKLFLFSGQMITFLSINFSSGLGILKGKLF